MKDRTLLRRWNRLDPLALFFQHSRERAVSRLLRQFYPDLRRWRILDVGCGKGRMLLLLREMEAGFEGRLLGSEITPEQLERQINHLGIGLMVNPPNSLPLKSESVDLVIQSVVFSSIPKTTVRMELAKEMNRVLRPGGHVLWYDVMKSRGNLVGFGKKEIDSLFPGYHLKGFKTGLSFSVARALAYKSQMLAALAETLPFWHSHWGLILSKHM